MGGCSSADTRIATATERHPETWAALVEAHGHGIVDGGDLTPGQQADEMLLMGLRLREGIDLDRLAALGGVRPSTGALDHLEGLGLIERAQPACQAHPGVVGNWRANELDPIPMCAGPGLVPDAAAGGRRPQRAARADPRHAERPLRAECRCLGIVKELRASSDATWQAAWTTPATHDKHSAMLKRLYDWMMRKAADDKAPWALGVVSFVESSFFPIPPDVMLIPMIMANRAEGLVVCDYRDRDVGAWRHARLRHRLLSL